MPRKVWLASLLVRAACFAKMRCRLTAFILGARSYACSMPDKEVDEQGVPLPIVCECGKLFCSEQW